MGYQTYFDGQFLLDRPLTAEHKKILEDFNEQRHEPGECLDKNLYTYYCQWKPNEDGTAIEWDQGEKFYYYVEWMEYLCDHFLTPWGYMVAGVVYWDGEESDDRGRMVIDSPLNKVRAENPIITWPT